MYATNRPPWGLSKLVVIIDWLCVYKRWPTVTMIISSDNSIMHCCSLCSTVRCFRWRLADNCGSEHSLKCSLRHRANLYQALATDSSLTQATLLSPGFDRPNQAYYNRNLCIYNISLDCPEEEEVELIPTDRTTYLSDAQTCRDYLSFHVESQTPPLIELCGARPQGVSHHPLLVFLGHSVDQWQRHWPGELWDCGQMQGPCSWARSRFRSWKDNSSIILTTQTSFILL